MLVLSLSPVFFLILFLRGPLILILEKSQTQYQKSRKQFSQKAHILQGFAWTIDWVHLSINSNAFNKYTVNMLHKVTYIGCTKASFKMCKPKSQILEFKHK